MTPEGLLKREICDWLATQPCLFTLTTNIQASRKMARSRYNLKGWPDITGTWKGGRMFLIEVKTPTGVLSDDQKEVIQRARAMGAVAFVARSVDDVKWGLAQA